MGFPQWLRLVLGVWISAGLCTWLYTVYAHVFWGYTQWMEGEAAGGCPLNGGGKGMARKTMLGGKVDYIRGQERQCWGVRLTI